MKLPSSGESTFLFWTGIVLIVVFVAVLIYAMIHIFRTKKPKSEPVLNYPMMDNLDYSQHEASRLVNDPRVVENPRVINAPRTNVPRVVNTPRVVENSRVIPSDPYTL